MPGDWEYMVGGGAATFDCDDDGFPDLFLSGGSGPVRVLSQHRDAGRRARLRSPVESGLELTGVTGAYPLDIDSDGMQDLVLLRVGENVVMRGLGDCRFERANEAWGFDGGDAWSAALAATWEHGADLAHHRHRQLHRPQGRGLSLGLLHRQLAAPTGRERDRLCAAAAADAQLLRAVDAVHRLEPLGHAVAARVQRPRILQGRAGADVAHRARPAAPSLYTEADGWKRLRIWGMGIASTDLNGDGYPEYFLTSMADNKLQTLAAPADGPAAKPSLCRRGLCHAA